MELVFQEKKLEYFGKTLQETILLEETTDVIVPDNGADAERVVDAFGTPLLRAAECSATGASVAGTVQTGVLYVDVNGQLQNIPVQIPFSARRETGQMPPDSYLQCKCILRSVDARLLNSRKILVRVSLACVLTVLSRLCCNCYTIEAPSEQLQLKELSLPLRVPVAVGEKTFPLNEELELPQDLPAVARLLKSCYRLTVAEQKLIGSKAVFKCELLVHVLYEDEDGGLHTQQWQQPFSQFVQMDQELDDAELETGLLLTSLETEPDSPYDCRRLLLSANVMAQCRAIGTVTAELIEDAYCTDAELIPQWENWSMEAVLDRQQFHPGAVARAEQSAHSLVDAWALPDVATCQREEDAVWIDQPVNVNLLFLDEEGALQGRTLRPVVRQATQLGEKGTVQVSAVPEHWDCKAANGILEAQVGLSMLVESAAIHDLRAMVGGKVEPFPPVSGRRPAVLLQRIEEEGDLWEIAKAYHRPMQAILEANELSEPLVNPGTLLLIPL